LDRGLRRADLGIKLIGDKSLKKKNRDRIDLELKVWGFLGN